MPAIICVDPNDGGSGLRIVKGMSAVVGIEYNRRTPNILEHLTTIVGGFERHTYRMPPTGFGKSKHRKQMRSVLTVMGDLNMMSDFIGDIFTKAFQYYNTEYSRFLENAIREVIPQTAPNETPIPAEVWESAINLAYLISDWDAYNDVHSCWEYMMMPMVPPIIGFVWARVNADAKAVTDSQKSIGLSIEQARAFASLFDKVPEQLLDTTPNKEAYAVCSLTAKQVGVLEGWAKESQQALQDAADKIQQLEKESATAKAEEQKIRREWDVKLCEVNASRNKEMRAKDAEIRSLTARIAELEEFTSSLQAKTEALDDGEELYELPEEGVLFAGGHSSVVSRIQKLFPKWKYLGADEVSWGNFSGVDLVICHTAFSAHKTSWSAISSAGVNAICIRVSATNIPKLIKEMRQRYTTQLKSQQSTREKQSAKAVAI